MKNRIPFNIAHKDEILSGKYTVETRDGQRVQIVLWDWEWPFPILGRIGQDGDPHIWTNDGTVNLSGSGQHDWDLFIVTDIEKLTTFEKSVQVLMDKVLQGIVNPSHEEDVKECASRLIDIAKGDLCEETDEDKEENCTCHKVYEYYAKGYNIGYDDGYKRCKMEMK